MRDDIVVITELYVRQPDQSITRVRKYGDVVLDVEANFPVVLFEKPSLRPADWLLQEQWLTRPEAAGLFPDLALPPSKCAAPALSSC